MGQGESGDGDSLYASWMITLYEHNVMQCEISRDCEVSLFLMMNKYYRCQSEKLVDDSELLLT
jgi:hypothetical protein